MQIRGHCIFLEEKRKKTLGKSSAAIKACAWNENIRKYTAVHIGSVSSSRKRFGVEKSSWVEYRNEKCLRKRDSKYAWDQTFSDEVNFNGVTKCNVNYSSTSNTCFYLVYDHIIN